MDKEDYKYEFGQMITESTYFRRHLKKIVAKSQAGTIKLRDGSRVKVALTTASVVLGIHGALNKNNQVKMAQILPQDKAGFANISGFALKQSKYGNKVHVGAMS